MTWDDLPGGDLGREGLDDLRNGRATAPALLVAIGAPRLRRLGIVVPETFDDPEHPCTRCLCGPRATPRTPASTPSFADW